MYDPGLQGGGLERLGWGDHCLVISECCDSIKQRGRGASRCGRVIFLGICVSPIALSPCLQGSFPQLCFDHEEGSNMLWPAA